MPYFAKASRGTPHSPFWGDVGWCPRSDSNRQALRQRILSPSRIPIPPLGHYIIVNDLSCGTILPSIVNPAAFL